VQKKNKKKKFGKIAIELGFLEPKKLNEYLETPEIIRSEAVDFDINQTID